MVAGLVFSDGRNLSSAALTASVRVARNWFRSKGDGLAAIKFPQKMPETRRILKGIVAKPDWAEYFTKSIDTGPGLMLNYGVSRNLAVFKKQLKLRRIMKHLKKLICVGVLVMLGFSVK